MNTDLPGDIGYNHPPIDAIGQFKLINNNQTAQYGLSSGIVSFAFKSGTNAYHGSAFDYLAERCAQRQRFHLKLSAPEEGAAQAE